MGWKNLKDHFGITRHHVQVTEKGIHIGSGYVSDLLTIDPETGEVRENRTFSGFLQEYYPKLLETSRDEILKLIESPDTFSTSIPVYTYEGAKILEKQCEVTGWPNATHDGCMMYENMFSTDKDKVVGWAKSNAAAAIHLTREQVAEAERDLARLKARLAQYEKDQVQLETVYSSGEASEQIVLEHKFRKSYPTLAKMVGLLLEKRDIPRGRVFQEISPGLEDGYLFRMAEQDFSKRGDWDLKALCFGEDGCSDSRGVDVEYEEDCLVGVPHEAYAVIARIKRSVEKLAQE